ncbi:DUF1102 domain-containing protein [Halorubrum ezzemoulense]|nr:DUF1102 domain-containing protein [Halorubrum ezzemoulense]
MPNRRKFITGLGALAAGSAAAVGTGAFTSVEATRSVEVNVTGDADAYLGLKAADHPNGDAYVDDSGDTVAIDITETTNDDNETLGSGLNPNATTVIENLLVVTNQGTQDGVGVWVDIDLGDIGSTDFTVYDQSQGPDADLEQEAVSLDTGNSLTMGVEIEAASPGELEDGEVTINGDTRENVWPQNTGGE